MEEDLSLIVDEVMALGSILSLIKACQPELIADLSYGGSYRSAAIGVGKKSPLIHITYRAPDRTLSSKEVGVVRQTIIAALAKHEVSVRTT